jgi:hypothetical protein
MRRRINSETPDDRPSISMLHALIRLLLDPDFLVEDIVAPELMKIKIRMAKVGAATV